jgi:hypothetical protein
MPNFGMRVGIVIGAHMGCGPPSDYDADSASYAAAVAAAGVTVTAAQRLILSNFFAAEKLAGRWTGHLRLYLHGWGSAAANKIDLKTLAVGTYAGTVTHAAGYAEGSADGAFILDQTSAGLGVATNSHCMTNLVVRAHQAAAYSTVFAGGTDGSSIQVLENGSHDIEFYSVSGTPCTITGATGVIVCSRTASNAVNVVRRLTAGVTSATSTVASSAIGEQVLSGWARASASSLFGNQRVGFRHIGVGLSVVAATEFSQNIKTLWEGLYGQTLP